MTVISLLFAISVFGLVCLFTTPGEAQALKSAPDAQVLASRNNAFGMELFERLCESRTAADNVFISPTSVAQALGMLYIGSAGNTKTEIAQTLHLSGMSDDGYKKDNAALLSSLSSTGSGVQSSIANAIWSQLGSSFGPSYSQSCIDYFSAQAKSVDFKRPPEAAAVINGWVNEYTKGKISDLVSGGALEGASAVLTNAIYFKGTWLTPFDPTSTVLSGFTLSSGSTIQVPTMFQNGDLSTYTDPAYTVICLPYSGSPSTSMIIVLPEAGQSVGDLLKTIDAHSFDAWAGKMNSGTVELSMPKFHVEYSNNLSGILTEMGMKSAFTRSADFSATGIPHLLVSGVIHKSVMDVDEQGTVAAAATGVIMRSLAIRVPRVIKIDHPFLCAIRQNETGDLLFLGAINRPNVLK